MKTAFAFGVPYHLLLLFIAVVPALAQKTVDAKEIIEQINRKQAVTYQDVTITGDLDLTDLANRREVREGSRLGETQEYLSTVEVPLTFRNCQFRGKVLAYRTEEGKLTKTTNRVYNADFTEAVTVEGCTFEDDAAFKYAVFEQRALFTDNRFRDGALFKYTKFRNAADFSGSTFRDYADFKYTKFGESSTFRNVAFERSADFKYTKFDEGVDFRQARFAGNADFKYTNFPRGTSFADARFDGSADFKYTTLDGRKFTPNDR